MLDLLRNNSRSFLIYLMFAVIIVVFAFTFGAITPDQACSGGGPMQVADLAKVEGAAIDTNVLNLADELSFSPPGPKSTAANVQELRRAYLQTRFGQLALYSPYSGGTFGRNPADISPIKAVKLMDELIETKLVAGYARELGMTVTQKELSDRLAVILSNFLSPTDGTFDQEEWVGYLRRIGTTPSAFEGFVADEILRERVIALMIGGVGLTDEQHAAAERLLSEKVKIEIVAVDPTVARALVPVTDAEVDTFAKDNAEKVEAEYEAKKATKFTTPKQWHLRAIKLDAPVASGDADEEQAALNAALRAEIAERAAAVKAEAAEAVANPAPAAPDAPEDDGEPAATPEAPETPSEAFGRVAAAKSDHSSKDDRGRLETPFSARDLGRWPFGPKVQAAVTALTAGAVSDVVEMDDGYWIFYADKVTEPVVTSLEDARREIATDLLQGERVAEFAKTLAGEVLAEAKKDPSKPLADAVAAVNARHGAAEGAGLSAREAQPFARLESMMPGFPAQIPNVGNLGKSPALVRAAFAATAEEPLLDGVFTIEPQKTTHVVGRFIERVADEEIPEEERQAERDQRDFEKQRLVYRGWYEGYLAAKQRSGDVEYTEAWRSVRQQAEEAYRAAGGVLTESTAAAAP